jgi:hypothetical protein
VLLAFPAGVTGDMVAHEIQAGYTPEVLRVTPESWVTLSKNKAPRERPASAPRATVGKLVTP